MLLNQNLNRRSERALKIYTFQATNCKVLCREWERVPCLVHLRALLVAHDLHVGVEVEVSGEERHDARVVDGAPARKGGDGAHLERLVLARHRHRLHEPGGNFTFVGAPRRGNSSQMGN